MAGSDTYDVIVLGVGTMGAAACDHLARRGVRVLGLERASIPNATGSAHGDSRLIRLCYFEHPDYVPLLHSTYAAWTALEERSGRSLLHVTGGLYAGHEDGVFIRGTLRSAREHGLPHEPLTVDEVRKRFDVFRVPDDYVGIFEPRAGFVLPEATIAAHAEEALKYGAVLRGHERVRAWRAEGDGVVVETDDATYRAARLVVCAGAWSAAVLGSLGVALTVTRQPIGWVWPREPDRFRLGTLPIWGIAQRDDSLFYGFPMIEGRPGAKIALHRNGPRVDPDTIDRTPNDDDEQTFRPLLQRHLPAADGPLLSMAICMYTNSPDAHFIVDAHPEHPQVVIATGFSGHGFKFAPVMGEILADLALDGATDHPIGFLRLDRLTTGSAAAS